VDKKAADPDGREGAAVFGEPVALRQPLFGDLHEAAAGARGGKPEPHLQLGIEQLRAGIGLDAPQRGSFIDLKGADRWCQFVKHRRHGERRIGAPYLGDDAQRTTALTPARQRRP